MNIQVEYLDITGTITYQTHHLTRIAFAKHMATAGQNYAPRPQKLIRTLGMFLHYSSYLQRHALNSDRFSEPPIHLSDPTEKGQFSNLAGKAIADFLSKRIDKSLYTVNYEAAMRTHRPPIPLSMNGKQVKRPDLLAFTTNSIFAIEAKGYSNGYGNMNKHKKQSQTGGIQVNYTVASVSYDLYSQIKCKYHDPINDNVPYDNEKLSHLTKEYYNGLSDFLNEKHFNYRVIEIQGEKFYEIEFLLSTLEKIFPHEIQSLSFRNIEFLECINPRIILPFAIREYAENGITKETKPFIYQGNENEYNTYIDNDRVGLRIK